MKRTVLGIVLMGLMGAGSLMASDWRSDRNFYNGDRRADVRDIHRDQREIAQDRRALDWYLRHGHYAAAEQERRELRNEYRDVHQDRRDLRRDNRFYDWR